MKNVPLLLILLLLGSAIAGACTHTATVLIHYPDSYVCSNCLLYFATNLNWATYTPEAGYTSGQFVANHTGLDTWTYAFTFNDTQAGEEIVATSYYSAWKSTAADRAWLNSRCRNVLNNKSGSVKGYPVTYVLPDSDVIFHHYPYYCLDQGEVRNLTLFSPQLNLNKTVHYYVPPSILENPLAVGSNRQVFWEFSVDGFLLEASFAHAYDFLIAQGLVPERVVYGLGQCIPTDPWSDGGSERVYETQPWVCTIPFPMPSCPARSGGGYSMLDFVVHAARPAIQKALGLCNPSRSRQLITGFSNGGLDACTFAYTNSSVFSRGYCGSGALWYDGQHFARIVNETDPDHDIVLYLDTGAHELQPMPSNLMSGYNALLGKSDTFRLGRNLMGAFYISDDSSHQPNAWSRHLGPALMFLHNPRLELGSSREGKIVAFPPPHRSFSLTAVFNVPSATKGDSEKGAVPFY